MVSHINQREKERKKERKKHVCIDEPIEFEEEPLEVQEFKKNSYHFGRILGIHLELRKKNRKIATCNPLDLETLGS